MLTSGSDEITNEIRAFLAAIVFLRNEAERLGLPDVEVHLERAGVALAQKANRRSPGSARNS